MSFLATMTRVAAWVTLAVGGAGVVTCLLIAWRLGRKYGTFERGGRSYRWPTNRWRKKK